MHFLCIIFFISIEYAICTEIIDKDKDNSEMNWPSWLPMTYSLMCPYISCLCYTHLLAPHLDPSCSLLHKPAFFPVIKINKVLEFRINLSDAGKNNNSNQCSCTYSKWTAGEINIHTLMKITFLITYSSWLDSYAKRFGIF